jgi:hypothetical protein
VHIVDIPVGIACYKFFRRLKQNIFDVVSTGEICPFTIRNSGILVCRLYLVYLVWFTDSPTYFGGSRIDWQM